MENYIFKLNNWLYPTKAAKALTFLTTTHIFVNIHIIRAWQIIMNSIKHNIPKQPLTKQRARALIVKLISAISPITVENSIELRKAVSAYVSTVQYLKTLPLLRMLLIKNRRKKRKVIRRSRIKAWLLRSKGIRITVTKFLYHKGQSVKLRYKSAKASIRNRINSIFTRFNLNLSLLWKAGISPITLARFFVDLARKVQQDKQQNPEQDKEPAFNQHAYLLRHAQQLIEVHAVRYICLSIYLPEIIRDINGTERLAVMAQELNVVLVDGKIIPPNYLSANQVPTAPSIAPPLG